MIHPWKGASGARLSPNGRELVRWADIYDVPFSFKLIDALLPSPAREMAWDYARTWYRRPVFCSIGGDTARRWL